MCLIIDKDFKTRQEARDFAKNPSIAKKDIIVYKVITCGGIAPYRRNVKYEKGFHYYQDGRPFSFSYNNSSNNIKSWELAVNAGLHSCKDYLTAKRIVFDNDRIIKMVIPKGARYFESRDKYVSDQLIWY